MDALIKVLVTFQLLQLKTMCACDCVMTPVVSHVKEARIIVVGRIIELLDAKEQKEALLYNRVNHSYRVKVLIKENLKGELNEGQIVELNSDYSNCDLTYENSKEYILFLVKERGNYYNKPCSYSGLSENSKGLIRMVRKSLKNNL